MSLAVIERSPFNPFPFYEEDAPARSPLYNSVQPGTDWHINSLRKGQQKTNYYYKAQTGDPVQLQFSTYPPTTLTLQLLDRMGQVVFDFSAAMQSATLPGNTMGTPTATVSLITYHFKLTFAQIAGLAQGLYCMRLTATWGTPFVPGYRQIKLLSEPIYIKAKHPGTLLITSTHRKNEFDTLFTPFNAAFSRRVEGSVHGLKLLSTDNDSQDSLERVHSQYSYPQNSRSLTVAGGRGLPEWALLGANYAVRTSSIRIDGRLYVRDIGAKWEMIEPDPAYPLGGATIAIREASPSDVYTLISYTPTPLFTRGNIAGVVQPYALKGLTMSSGAVTVAIKDAAGNTNIGIYNGGYEASLLIHLNSAFSAQNNLTGFFAFAGDTLYYYNNAGEGFGTTGGTVYTKSIRVTGGRSGSIGSHGITFGITASDAMVAWDEGTTPVAVSTTPTTSISHTYSGTTWSATAYLFHNDSIEALSTSDDTVLSIGGDCPGYLEKLDMAGSSMTSFNAAFLAPCVSTLYQLEIRQGILAAISNFTQAFTNLSVVNLFSNLLPVSVVTNTIIDFYFNGAATPTPDTFDIHGQLPSPPGPTAAASIAALSASGWSVITD